VVKSTTRQVKAVNICSYLGFLLLCKVILATFSFTLHLPSVVDPELFFSDSDPDPTFQLVSDPHPVFDPT
jgi:hypothetical protein